MKQKKMKNLKALKKALKNKPIIIIVGLGNPGVKYRKTRHNAGFAVIDYIADICNVNFKKNFLRPCLSASVNTDSHILHLVKPLTFMNRSGDVLDYVMRKTGADVDDMIIICDNMDLKPGMIRLKIKGSSAGHNGIKSVIDNLERSDFKRMYIGVGRPADGISVVEHVLGEFEPEDELKFKSSIGTAAQALIDLGVKPLHLVMNEINKKNN